VSTKKFGNKFSNVAKFEDPDVYRKPKSMKVIGDIIESYDDEYDDQDWANDNEYEEWLNYQEYLVESSRTSKDWFLTESGHYKI